MSWGLLIIFETPLFLFDLCYYYIQFFIICKKFFYKNIFHVQVVFNEILYHFTDVFLEYCKEIPFMI